MDDVLGDSFTPRDVGKLDFAFMPGNQTRGFCFMLQVFSWSTSFSRSSNVRMKVVCDIVLIPNQEFRVRVQRIQGRLVTGLVKREAAARYNYEMAFTAQPCCWHPYVSLIRTVVY